VTTSVQLKWSLLNASSGWLLDFSCLQVGKRPTVEVEKRMVADNSQWRAVPNDGEDGGSFVQTCRVRGLEPGSSYEFRCTSVQSVAKKVKFASVQSV
jgi:hypothetical protein